MTDSSPFKDILATLAAGRHLTADEMEQAMSALLQGRAEPAQTGAFLMGLSQRQPDSTELAAAATILRRHAATLHAPPGTIDCCGTGGDNHSTYNISTAVAIVAAACGVRVAKHGNRASSSRSGAADVLEALGVNLDASTDRLEHALGKLGFCFLMAPNHHKALAPIAPVRKSLGFRTIFNILGPLANPAGADHNLLGVYTADLLTPMAEVLKKLGVRRAWVVHGRDGLDEITLTGPTDIAILEDGIIRRDVLRPEDFTLPSITLSDIYGGDARENAQALQALLDGQDSAYRAITLANTAAVMHLARPETSLADAASRAADAIDSGAARTLLQNYIALTGRDGK